MILDRSTAIESKTIALSVENQMEEILFVYCVTRTHYWYVGSYTGMDGSTYDVYDRETTTTCY